MITPEPPAGSEHYREGWRHGYEQAAIDRERSAAAVRLVPDTGQDREPVMTETTRELARRVTQYRRESLGWLKQAIRADGEAGEATALVRERQIAVLTTGDGHVDCAIEPSPDTGQAPDVVAPIDWLARHRAAAEADLAEAFVRSLLGTDTPEADRG